MMHVKFFFILDRAYHIVYGITTQIHTRISLKSLKSERVTIFFIKCGDEYYIYIILIPIHLDWVTISSFKNIAIGKYRHKM